MTSSNSNLNTIPNNMTIFKEGKNKKTFRLLDCECVFFLVYDINYKQDLLHFSSIILDKQYDMEIEINNSKKKFDSLKIKDAKKYLSIIINQMRKK